MSQEIVKKALEEAQRALSDLFNNEQAICSIDQAATLMAQQIEKGAKVFSCGNGGSLCDAMHFAEELSGRFREDRRAIPAIAIADASHLSCVANDYGYEYVFSRYLEALGNEGDVLLGISTSGKSQNIIRAAEVAKRKNMKLIVLTGKADSELAKMADVAIVTPGGRYADRVQELHIKCIHIMIEVIEKKLT